MTRRSVLRFVGCGCCALIAELRRPSHLRPTRLDTQGRCRGTVTSMFKRGD